ncbi:hypothetical protein Hanom_Chr13g01185741 [Helianthus anomalus]
MAAVSSSVFDEIEPIDITKSSGVEETSLTAYRISEDDFISELQCECNTLKFTRWLESENPKSNMGLILSPNRCSKRSVQDINI